MKTHKDLDVWKFGIDFVMELYMVTAQFLKEEIYGIISQMRRAAISIPSNIAEGAARIHKTEFRQFLYIALSSAAELETQLIISEKLLFIPKVQKENLVEKLNTISRMLQGLIKTTITNH
jgi:four helix bundle protein